ncbi:hypothetical protein AHiyo8_32250 [Arthrobacter sp. Hiyo8]|nr:hypothetical protein AHiyo8_32250 [Arthrobacter sp. Hiyo8]
MIRTARADELERLRGIEFAAGRSSAPVEWTPSQMTSH